MFRRIAPCLILLLLAAAVAGAQPQRPLKPKPSRAGHWDFSLQTRYSPSRTFDYDSGSSLAFKEDIGWGFGFAYNFDDRFNLGLVFTWKSLPYEVKAVSATDPDDVVNYGGALSVSSVGVTGDWNLRPGLTTPYITGSAAWVLIDTNIFAGYGGGCYWDPWWGYVCGTYPATYGTDTGAFNLGAGMRIALSEAFYCRVGYEYSWIGDGPFEGTHIIRVDLGLMN